MIFSISKRKLICGFLLVILTIGGVLGGVYLVTKNNKDNYQNESNFNNQEQISKIPNFKTIGPETQRILRERNYPLDDSGYYVYKYGEINRYLRNESELDELINYRVMVPSLKSHHKRVNFDKAFLESKLRKWIIKAIKQHNYFQHFENEPNLRVQYNMNIPAQKIDVNAVWSYKKDNDAATGKPIRYWDQFELKLK